MTTPEQTTPEQTTPWHLHRGTVQWFLVGPGPQAWLACSAPDYASRKPAILPAELAIARAALALLKSRHAQDTAAGVEEIKKALADAASGVKPAKPKPAAAPPLTAKHPKPEPIDIDPAEVLRIKRVVAEVTCISMAQIDSGSAAPSPRVSAAKNLFHGALSARWPRAENRQLAAAVNRSGSTFGSRLQRHRYNIESFTDYARKFRRILDQLGLEPATR